MKKILVRADDLGYSEAVNYGIEKSVKEGIVKSVGVMTNMPSTIHGINLLKDSDACFGLHINICVGKPLCDPSLIPSIVNEKGEFKSSKEYRSAKEDFVVLEEVMMEVEAQYLKYVELMGKKPSYFEGHAVSSHNFFKAMEMIAKKYDCDYLPLGFGRPVKFKDTYLHFVMDSMNPDYNPSHTLKKCLLKEYDQGIPMLILHPGYLDYYIMNNSSLLKPRVLEVEMACSQEVKRWLIEHDVQVVTYDDLK